MYSVTRTASVTLLITSLRWCASSRLLLYANSQYVSTVFPRFIRKRTYRFMSAGMSPLMRFLRTGSRTSPAAAMMMPMIL